MAKKQKIALLPDQAAASATLSALGRAIVDRDKTVAIRDAQMDQIRAQYAADLANLDAMIDTLTDQLRFYAEAHKAELFAEKRSLELAAGRIGFRTHPPSLRMLPKMSAASVVERLDAAGFFELIRTIREPNKEAILERRATLDLKRFGLCCGNDEQFFAEPRRDDELGARAVQVTEGARP